MQKIVFVLWLGVSGRQKTVWELPKPSGTTTTTELSYSRSSLLNWKIFLKLGHATINNRLRDVVPGSDRSVPEELTVFPVPVVRLE